MSQTRKSRFEQFKQLGWNPHEMQPHTATSHLKAHDVVMYDHFNLGDGQTIVIQNHAGKEDEWIESTYTVSLPKRKD